MNIDRAMFAFAGTMVLLSAVLLMTLPRPGGR